MRGVTDDWRARSEELLFSAHVVDRKTGAQDLALHLRGTRDAKALRMLLGVMANGVEHPLVRGEAYHAVELIAGSRGPGPTTGLIRDLQAELYSLPGPAVGSAAGLALEPAAAPERSDSAAVPAHSDPATLPAVGESGGEHFAAQVRTATDRLFGAREARGRAAGATGLAEVLDGTGHPRVLRMLLTVLANEAESVLVRDAAHDALHRIAVGREDDGTAGGPSGGRSGGPPGGESGGTAGGTASGDGRDEPAWALVRRLQEELYSGHVYRGQGEWLVTYGNVVSKLLERVPEIRAHLGTRDLHLPQAVFDRLFGLVLDRSRALREGRANPALDGDLLDRAFAFIEEAAGSHDAHVVNLVAASVMEKLDDRLREGERQLFVSRFGPASVRLLERVDAWWERYEAWWKERARPGPDRSGGRAAVPLPACSRRPV
jgi:hypothetical protein